MIEKISWKVIFSCRQQARDAVTGYAAGCLWGYSRSPGSAADVASTASRSIRAWLSLATLLKITPPTFTLAVELDKAFDKSGSAAGKPLGIDHQKNSRAGQSCYLGSTPFVRTAADAVKKAHDPFNDGNVGIGSVGGVDLPDGLRRADPGVKVERRPAGNQSVVAGVDEVRADLERGYLEAAPFEALQRPMVTVVLPLPLIGAAMMIDFIITFGFAGTRFRDEAKGLNLVSVP